MESTTTFPDEMPAPRLSSLQRSYRDNPSGFMARLWARAESLVRDGYTVCPESEVHRFLVAHTNPKDGKVTEYVVSAWEKRCTCPFFMRQVSGEYLTEDCHLIPCKHLLGLPTLVRETWRRHAREGDVSALTSLWRHWMVFVAARRRRRQEKDHGTAGHKSVTCPEHKKGRVG